MMRRKTFNNMLNLTSQANSTSTFLANATCKTFSFFLCALTKLLKQLGELSGVIVKLYLKILGSPGKWVGVEVGLLAAQITSAVLRTAGLFCFTLPVFKGE